MVRRGVKVRGDDAIGRRSLQRRVARVGRVRTVLVEFVNDRLERVLVLGLDEETGTGLVGLVAPDLELLDLERPVHVHDEAETGFHHPRVDDVSRQLHRSRSGHGDWMGRAGQDGCVWHPPRRDLREPLTTEQGGRPRRDLREPLTTARRDCRSNARDEELSTGWWPRARDPVDLCAVAPPTRAWTRQHSDRST